MGLEGNFSWVTCLHLSQIVAQVTLVYLLKKLVCFVCHIKISQITFSHDVLGILGKPLMSTSAPRVFGSV